MPTRFLVNQCQIITFLILKYDITENSRIELRGIVLPVQVGGLLGGAKGYVGPPSQIIGGGGLAPPWPPSSYAYVNFNFSPSFRTHIGFFKEISESIGDEKNSWSVGNNYVKILISVTVCM